MKSSWLWQVPVWATLVWGCVHSGKVGEGPSARRTEVVIIGTFHGMHYSMPNYHPDTLRYLLEIAKPDVLALELRPEDVTAEGYGKAPMDITKIAIPWALKKNIPFRPIDWWKDGSRKEHEAFLKGLESTEEGKQKLAQLKDEMSIHADRFTNPADMTVEYIHSEEFARRDREVRQDHTQVLGEGPGNLFWYERAEKMLELLKPVLNEFAGKRVLIVTGSAHRGDFEESLRKLDSVTLLSVNQLPRIKDLPPYTGVAGGVDEIKQVLFSWVQGPRANTAPDSIDVKTVSHLIEVAREVSGMNAEEPAWITFAEAERLYLARDYEKALVAFETVSAKALPTDQVFGIPLNLAARFRQANMMDLLGRRDPAKAIYQELLQSPSVTKIAQRYLESAFQRRSAQ